MKLFGKWDMGGIKVEDPGLKPYINLTPLLVPKTCGRNIKIGRYKTQIVERLISKLMVPGHKGKKHKITSGHCTGKSQNKMKIVEKAFEIIEQKTKENPIKVFVKAIENAAPREEITTIEYGGARYPQAVEASPSRRVDIVLRMMVQGAYSKSFNTKKKIINCLADEILAAYKNESTSNAISKKTELERQADASK